MSLNKQEILARAHSANLPQASPAKAIQLPIAGGVICEGERNDTLYRLACSLQGKGYSDSQIRDELARANEDRCIPPLSTNEVEQIFQSVLRYPKGDSGAMNPSKRKNGVDHVEMGEALVSQYSAKMIEGVPCVWDFDRYLTGWDSVSRCMIARESKIKERERKEVRAWLELEAPDEKMGNPKYIAFNNGVLDIETMELIVNTPKLNIINVIPHDWNPDACSAVLEEALNSWSCGDLDVRTNIEEVIGLAMYRGRDLAACPVLIGEGANGKSTFLKFLRNMLGEENVSSMDLATVGKRFQGAALVGKLANIGDDISSEFVNRDQASIIKKVISGDPIQVEEKYGNPFSFRPYCSLIFSCNEFPRIGDNTYGMHRRFIPVPFYANFSVPSGPRDLKMESKLDQEDAYETAIILGVHALKACLDRGQMLPNQTQAELKEDMKIENSPVYLFCCEELGYKTPEERCLHREPVDGVYKDYCDFCERYGFNPKNSSQFSKEIRKILGIKSDRRYINGQQKRCFIDPRQDNETIAV